MNYYYVYILESQKHGSLYIGCTKDLLNRYKQHNTGLVKSTKPYTPYTLIYYEAFLSKKDALVQEKYLKSGSGKELIKSKLKSYFEN